MSRTSRAHDWPDERAETIAELAAAPLDLLIIGGGIVGAGIARDAAMRGLRTGLVERHDFAYGTSSRSSRLLHGGLRYLAQGRIGLVREASIEKRIVHDIAPHISAPLAFVFPTYRASPWAPWAHWKLAIGVRIYDWLCGGRNFGPSTSMRPEEVLEKLPGLRPEGLTGAVRYFDGFTSDARLVIDTLRSAARAGGLLVNHCRLEDARLARDHWVCAIRDVLTDRQHEVAARAVVNATGPWSEGLCGSSIRLRLTKGVHLVIDRQRLPVPEAVVMTEDRRILFAIPWGQRVILGTTDTDYSGACEDVRVDPEDVRYILEIVNHAFPHAALSTQDVISTWAGLRPLIADPKGRPSDISRSHEIVTTRPGWWDVAGGKLTTYRLMAEQTIDRVEAYLERPRTECRTALEPLLPRQEVIGSGLLPPDPAPDVVAHYCQREWAVHLDDVMVRRAGWHYYCHDVEQIAANVCAWMGEGLGWDAARREMEMERYAAVVQADRAVTAGTARTEA